MDSEVLQMVDVMGFKELNIAGIVFPEFLQLMSQLTDLLRCTEK